MEPHQISGQVARMTSWRGKKQFEDGEFTILLSPFSSQWENILSQREMKVKSGHDRTGSRREEKVYQSGEGEGIDHLPHLLNGGNMTAHPLDHLTAKLPRTPPCTSQPAVHCGPSLHHSVPTSEKVC